MPSTEQDAAEVTIMAKQLWLRVLETDQQVVYLEGEPPGTFLFLAIGHRGLQDSIRHLVMAHAAKGVPATVRRVPSGEG